MNRTYLAVALCAALALGAEMAWGNSSPPLLPDATLTPGATDPAVTQANIATTICRKGGYTSSVRNVPQAEKNQVYAEYHITSHPTGQFEIDHLISLEIGGSNDIKNLWPQSYVTKPYNAHVKDKLENALHKLVCAGKLKLAEAQRAISQNWMKALQVYDAKDMPK